MLWFRTGAVGALITTLTVAVACGCSVFIMCVNPTNARAMTSDPFYNGNLSFYVMVIISQMAMAAASLFGFIIAFRVWRNNHQMDHKLRHLFTLWLVALGLSIMITFILGILGLVRYREPQEEVVSLFEIFSKYNQDVKFVGSFERYQRENSCCGINGPNDWMLAQIKGGGGGGNMYGGAGEFGAFDTTYMGSPSTGKCHLTPPTIPMGCGKKLLEEIQFTRTVYCTILLFEVLAAVSSAILGWYCFFYWIEKEVIIIPEDEVSNLIVIEPESSTSTAVASFATAIPSGWSGNVYSAHGSHLTSYSRTGSGSRYSRDSGYSRARSYNRPSRYSYNGNNDSKSFYPNSKRTIHSNRDTKFSNFYGSVPSIGGPHAAYHPPYPDDSGELIDRSFIDPDEELLPPPENDMRRNTGLKVPPSQQPFRGHPPQISISRVNETVQHLQSGYYGRSIDPLDYGSYSYGNPNSRSEYLENGERNRGGSRSMKASVISKKHKVHEKHSFNHMLHKQEKALGGKVLAEMHVDHSRDPDPINSNMDTAKGKKGHRTHHATIAIVKNKNPKKPKAIISGPEKAHGQTGHLAADILDMSGAAAAKSMIDDLQLPVEHDPHLAKKGSYVNKLHKTRKKKGQLDHPDVDHPGHGPVKAINGIVSAPSIDGSQAQSLVDNLLKPRQKRKEPEPIIKSHGVNEPPPNQGRGAVRAHSRHHATHPHEHHSRQHIDGQRSGRRVHEHADGNYHSHHHPSNYHSPHPTDNQSSRKYSHKSNYGGEQYGRSHHRSGGSIRTEVIFKNNRSMD